MGTRQRRSRRVRPPSAGARRPVSARFGSPLDRSWPHATQPSPRPTADLDAARAHLERAWRPGDDLWDQLRGLVADFGCSRRQAEILLAERDAVQRTRDAGLDPAPVRDQADRLLAERADR